MKGNLAFYELNVKDFEQDQCGCTETVNGEQELSIIDC